MRVLLFFCAHALGGNAGSTVLSSVGRLMGVPPVATNGQVPAIVARAGRLRAENLLQFDSP